MSKYTKTVTVEAHQITLSDEQKTSAKKGLPTPAHGGELKHEGNDIFLLPLHLNGTTVQAKEGDWVVNENGIEKLYSDEAFKKVFSGGEGKEELKGPPDPIKATEGSWETNKTHPAHIVTEEKEAGTPLHSTEPNAGTPPSEETEKSGE